MFRMVIACILLVAPALAAPVAHGGANVCDTFSEATVRMLTGVPSGAFSKRVSRRGPNGERCVYGVYQGDLVLDVYRFASDAAAEAQLAKLGPVTNSYNFTQSPYGTDQVNEWHNVLSETADEEVFDLAGYAARHGSTVVAIGLDRPGSDFSKDGIKRLQGAALTTAGAQLAPWPQEDVCARVPAHAIQTLVALGPATVLTSVKKSSGGNSECDYEVHPYDSDDPVTMRVVLTAARYINDAEALGDLQVKGSSAPDVPTDDSKDRLLQIDSRKDTAYVLHAGDVGKVYVSSGEAAALDQPSYQVHLEQAALLAAGASVLPGTALSSIPAAVEPTWATNAQHDAADFLAHYWLVLVFVLLVAWFFWGRHRRHELILHGTPGTARVNAISDTGVTVNNSPMIRLHVTLTPQNGMPYEATATQTVSRLEAPASWVGRTLNVRIDPKNPQRFVVV